jgi:hypothetical protein
LPHGPLCRAEGTGERGSKQGSLMLDHDARKAAQNNLDAAQQVDTTARPVDIAHPDGDALDRTRILPEFFAESSPDVCPVIVVEGDSVNADVCGCCRGRRATSGPFDRPGHLIREGVALSRGCADPVAR